MFMKVKEKIQKKIDSIYDVPWGTHGSLFYQTKEELLELLVPYVKTGLERNEYCMWIISDILDRKEVIKALRKEIHHFEKYLDKPQIEIIPYTEWYLKNGVFNCQRVLKSWIDKLHCALNQGFAGMRITGDASWITKKNWKKFNDYETNINRVIENYRMIAVCSYSLNTLGASEIVDVVYNHPIGFIKQHGRWKIIERSESKKSEQEILKFKTISDRASYGIALIDLKGKFLYVNESFARMHGYSRDELIGKGFSVLHKGKQKKAACGLNGQLRRNGSYVSEEVWHTRKDNSVFPALTNGTFIRDEKGKALFIAVTAVDIADRKSTEKALRESEERLRAVFDTAQDSIFIKDRNLKYIQVNRAMEKLFGLPASKIIGKTDEELFGKEDGKHIRKMDSRVLKGEVIDEEHTKPVQGILFTFHVIKVPMYDKKGNIIGLCGIARDVTDRKKFEEELKRENKLRQVFLDSLPPVAMLLRTHTREIVACNKAGEEVGAVSGKTCYETWGQRSTPCPWCRAPEVWKTGKTQHFQTYGVGRYWDAYWVPVSDDLYLRYAYDITDRMILEQRNDIILRSSIDGFRIVDNDRNIVEVNDAYCTMIGYSREELLSMKVDDLEAVESVEDMEKHLQKIVDAGHDRYETRHRRKDGRVLDLAISVNYLNLSGGRFFAFFRDITERKKAEEEKEAMREQLIQSEKMASLGGIAAGIAHELNTPLNVILGYMELLNKKLKPDSPCREYVKISLEEVEQCRQLIDDFLFYARPVPSGAWQKELINLPEIVNAVVKLLIMPNVKKIKVNYDIERVLPFLTGDRKQLMQVFINLINNSIQAMPGGGTIEISARRIKDNKRERDEERIEFRVADTGVGISEENIGKVFDPFFTTKRPGKGTGLGLSVCQRIMKNHKGTLRIESQPGKGTTVVGQLPVKTNTYSRI